MMMPFWESGGGRSHSSTASVGETATAVREVGGLEGASGGREGGGVITLSSNYKTEIFLLN